MISDELNDNISPSIHVEKDDGAIILLSSCVGVWLRLACFLYV